MISMIETFFATFLSIILGVSDDGASSSAPGLVETRTQIAATVFAQPVEQPLIRQGTAQL